MRDRMGDVLSSIDEALAGAKDGFGGSEGWVLIRGAVYALAALWSDHEDYDPTWRTQ